MLPQSVLPTCAWDPSARVPWLSGRDLGSAARREVSGGLHQRVYEQERSRLRLHATDRRLFGVRSRRSGWGAGELGVLLGKDLGGKTRSIGDLEHKHDFVMDKTGVAQLEILKPGLFNRYLLVRRKNGKPVEIRFRGRSEYDQVVELMGAFLAEAVSVKGDRGA